MLSLGFRKLHGLGSLLACIFTFLLPVSKAEAQAASDRPITLIVGFAAGTAPDTLARLLAAGIQKNTGRSIVVENVAGAGGQIAAARVARSAPDGTTLLLGELGSVAIAPFAFTNLPYDPVKDFNLITEVAVTNFAFIVPAKTGPVSISSFIEGSKGGKPVLLATFGVSSPGHVAAELFGQTSGFKVEPVHYRAVADAMGDISNGLVSGAFVSVPLASAQHSGGLVRSIVQTGATRSALLKDVPTATEANASNLNMSSWFVLMAPAATPSALIEQYNAMAVAAVKDPAAVERMQTTGFEPVGSSIAAVRSMVDKERIRWKEVVEKAGIKVVN